MYLIKWLTSVFASVSLRTVKGIRAGTRTARALSHPRTRRIVTNKIRVVTLTASKSIATTMLTYTAIEAVPDLIIAGSTSISDNASPKTKADAWKEASSALTDIGWVGSVALVIWGATAYVVRKRDISLFARMQRDKGDSIFKPRRNGKGPTNPLGSDKPTGRPPSGSGPATGSQSNLEPIHPGNFSVFKAKMRSFFSSLGPKALVIKNIPGVHSPREFIKEWTVNSGSTNISAKFLHFIKNAEDKGGFFGYSKTVKGGKEVATGFKIIHTLKNGKKSVRSGALGGAILVTAWFYFLEENHDAVIQEYNSLTDELSALIKRTSRFSKTSVMSRDITPFYDLSPEGETLSLSKDEMHNLLNMLSQVNDQLLKFAEFIHYGEGKAHLPHVISAITTLLYHYDRYSGGFVDYIFPVYRTLSLINESLSAQNDHTLDDYLNDDGSFIIGENQDTFDEYNFDNTFNSTRSESNKINSFSASAVGDGSNSSDGNAVRSNVSSDGSRVTKVNLDIVNNKPAIVANLSLDDLDIRFIGRG